MRILQRIGSAPLQQEGVVPKIPLGTRQWFFQLPTRVLLMNAHLAAASRLIRLLASRSHVWQDDLSGYSQSPDAFVPGGLVGD